MRRQQQLLAMDGTLQLLTDAYLPGVLVLVLEHTAAVVPVPEARTALAEM